jgi:hypothetical protein
VRYSAFLNLRVIRQAYVEGENVLLLTSRNLTMRQLLLRRLTVVENPRRFPKISATKKD